MGLHAPMESFYSFPFAVLEHASLCSVLGGTFEL